MSNDLTKRTNPTKTSTVAAETHRYGLSPQRRVDGGCHGPSLGKPEPIAATDNKPPRVILALAAFAPAGRAAA